jgi:AraC-like DNA-binding protein
VFVIRDRVRTLLEAGWTRSAVARELGVHPSTVTRHARFLGIPDVLPRGSAFDWAAIGEYYDAGHTITECRERFGFSRGAWDKAVSRRDLTPRPRARQELAHVTRDRIEQHLARGASRAEVARTLELSRPTVSYHCRKLGLGTDRRFARRYDWIEIQRLIDEENLSMSEGRRRFGFSRHSWAEAIERGDISPRPHVTSIEELLVAGRPRSRGHIKSRLIKEGLKDGRCERCGINEWQGLPLNMELHHINGDGDDNRLDNLLLLCGNCHSQTNNWGGRGISRKRLLQTG